MNKISAYLFLSLIACSCSKITSTNPSLPQETSNDVVNTESKILSKRIIGEWYKAPDSSSLKYTTYPNLVICRLQNGNRIKISDVGAEYETKKMFVMSSQDYAYKEKDGVLYLYKVTKDDIYPPPVFNSKITFDADGSMILQRPPDLSFTVWDSNELSNATLESSGRYEVFTRQPK